MRGKRNGNSSVTSPEVWVDSIILWMLEGPRRVGVESDRIPTRGLRNKIGASFSRTLHFEWSRLELWSGIMICFYPSKHIAQRSRLFVTRSSNCSHTRDQEYAYPFSTAPWFGLSLGGKGGLPQTRCSWKAFHEFIIGLIISVLVLSLELTNIHTKLYPDFFFWVFLLC